VVKCGRMYRQIWTWDKCKSKITSLRGRLGFPDGSRLEFLKLNLSLETGKIHDQIKDKPLPEVEPEVYCILTGYANSQPIPETHTLVSFAQLPGGASYNNAFIRRAVMPIERAFGFDAEKLWDAAKTLGAERLAYEYCSVKVRALPLVPIIIILHAATSEFPASATMLFDSSASNYLSTEQLAMLGQLTSTRLRQVLEAIT